MSEEHTVRVLGVIPARGGSKGVPKKNIRELAGKPLIAYTIDAARQSQLLNDCIVSTDSEEIADAAREAGGNVPWLRPAEFATDEARAQGVALHALENAPSPTYDYLLMLQPTTPFRRASDIDASIRLAIEHDATSVVSFAKEETRHPYYMYYYDGGTPGHVEQAVDYEVGLPRQAFPRCLYRNGAIYLVKVDHLKQANSFVSDDLVPYIMPPERSINIDAEEDLLYAEFLLAKGVVQAP